MTITTNVQDVIQQKLAAFDHLQPEFEEDFRFLQEVHGQKRFFSFSVAAVVRYLHSRWICECKSRLLSVPQTIKEYEGRRCLELLWLWQEEEATAAVVEFLQYKLDMQPFADLTRQLQEARRVHLDEGMVQRLAHGRQILLNRGINLMHALDSIFALSQDDLFVAVHDACAQYHHLPQQLKEQMAELDSPLYAYVPNPALARRNMLIMNKLGVNVLQYPADLPGRRSWRVVAPVEPLSPFAEHVFDGYLELTAPLHNNIKHVPFVDRLERSDSGDV